MSGSSRRISDPTSTHIGSLRTEGTDIDSRKASAIDVDTLCVQPIVARFTRTVSNILNGLSWMIFTIGS